jgi:hypothetical protein
MPLIFLGVIEILPNAAFIMLIPIFRGINIDSEKLDVLTQRKN